MDTLHCLGRPSRRLTCEDGYMCYDTIDFSWYHLFWTLNPHPKPRVFPSTCAAHLLAIQSTNVGSSLSSSICTGVCISHYEGHRLLMSNASSINYAYLCVCLEVELFLIIHGLIIHVHLNNLWVYMVSPITTWGLYHAIAIEFSLSPQYLKYIFTFLLIAHEMTIFYRLPIKRS
jgi:hypothetical protein